MTVIVGIKCINGVVLGADSAATLGNAAGLATVLQPVSKLQVLGAQLIVGTSGPIGLGQLYADGVGKLRNDLRAATAADVCRKLRDGISTDAHFALKASALASTVVGPIAGQAVFTQTLVALACKSGPQLVQLDYQCNPELATDDLPFVAIGSGQSIADPFLAFLRYIFWPDQLPTIPEGIFAVTWTLTHAIRTAPGGIAGPIRVSTLQMEGTQPLAEELSQDQLKESQEAVTEAEVYLRQWGARQQQQPTGIDSQPPRPPGNSSP